MADKSDVNDEELSKSTTNLNLEDSECDIRRSQRTKRITEKAHQNAIEELVKQKTKILRRIQRKKITIESLLYSRDNVITVKNELRLLDGLFSILNDIFEGSIDLEENEDWFDEEEVNMCDFKRKINNWLREMSQQKHRNIQSLYLKKSKSRLSRNYSKSSISKVYGSRAEEDKKRLRELEVSVGFLEEKAAMRAKAERLLMEERIAKLKARVLVEEEEYSMENELRKNAEDNAFIQRKMRSIAESNRETFREVEEDRDTEQTVNLFSTSKMTSNKSALAQNTKPIPMWDTAQAKINDLFKPKCYHKKGDEEKRYYDSFTDEIVSKTVNAVTDKVKGISLSEDVVINKEVIRKDDVIKPVCKSNSNSAESATEIKIVEKFIPSKSTATIYGNLNDLNLIEKTSDDGEKFKGNSEKGPTSSFLTSVPQIGARRLLSMSSLTEVPVIQPNSYSSLEDCVQSPLIESINNVTGISVDVTSSTSQVVVLSIDKSSPRIEIVFKQVAQRIERVNKTMERRNKIVSLWRYWQQKYVTLKFHIIPFAWLILLNFIIYIYWKKKKKRWKRVPFLQIRDALRIQRKVWSEQFHLAKLEQTDRSNLRSSVNVLLDWYFS